MPKLTKQAAQQAAQAAEEWEDRDPNEPLEPGWYLCRLLSVEVQEGTKAPYWGWKFEDVVGEQWLWENTSLSEKAIGRLGKVFEAFEVPPDTDTDELIGELVNIEVGIETAAKGKRAGQLVNVVKGLAPASTHPDFADYVQAQGQAKPDPDEFKGRGRKPKPPTDEEPF